MYMIRHRKWGHLPVIANPLFPFKQSRTTIHKLEYSTDRYLLFGRSSFPCQLFLFNRWYIVVSKINMRFSSKSKLYILASIFVLIIPTFVLPIVLLLLLSTSVYNNALKRGNKSVVIVGSKAMALIGICLLFLQYISQIFVCILQRFNTWLYIQISIRKAIFCFFPLFLEIILFLYFKLRMAVRIPVHRCLSLVVFTYIVCVPQNDEFLYRSLFISSRKSYCSSVPPSLAYKTLSINSQVSSSSVFTPE